MIAKKSVTCSVLKGVTQGIQNVSQPIELFVIGGAIGDFLGDIEIKPMGSVACTGYSGDVAPYRF